MEELSARGKLKKARSQLMMKQPFFASIIMRMPLVEANEMLEGVGMPTMTTDGRAVYYHTDLVESLSNSELQFVYCHEAMHIALMHPIRRGGRNDGKWRKATDYAVNIPLVDAKLEMPQGKYRGLLDEQYRGMSAEQIYNKLPDSNQQCPMWGHGDCSHEGGQCGGVLEPKHEDGTPFTESEMAQLHGELRSIVNAAITQNKSIGNMPAGLEELLQEGLVPKVPWRERLRFLMEQIVRNDYNWYRPNRKMLAYGFSLPSLYNQQVGTIVLAIDSSGSVSNDELSQFLAENNSLLEQFDFEGCWVVYWDAAVQKIEHYEKSDLPLEPRAAGRGGTRVSSVFEWIEEEQIEPAVLVVLSDMHIGDFPRQAPDFPVLWVRSTTSGSEPPFGELVDLDM